MRILASSLLVLLLVPACDSDSKPKQSPDDAAAKKAAEEADEAKRIEERGKKRQAEEAAKVQAEVDRKAKMAELCVVPEAAAPKKGKKGKAPKLDVACDAMAEAQIAFLRRQYADNPDKLAGVETNAPMQKANIIKMCSSMDVALGLQNAFDNAPMGYGEHLNDLIAVCMEKLGRPEDASAAVPAKKPG